SAHLTGDAGLGGGRVLPVPPGRPDCSPGGNPNHDPVSSADPGIAALARPPAGLPTPVSDVPLSCPRHPGHGGISLHSFYAARFYVSNPLCPSNYFHGSTYLPCPFLAARRVAFQRPPCSPDRRSPSPMNCHDHSRSPEAR